MCAFHQPPSSHGAIPGISGSTEDGEADELSGNVASDRSDVHGVEGAPRSGGAPTEGLRQDEIDSYGIPCAAEGLPAPHRSPARASYPSRGRTSAGVRPSCGRGWSGWGSRCRLAPSVHCDPCGSPHYRSRLLLWRGHPLLRAMQRASDP